MQCGDCECYVSGWQPHMGFCNAQPTQGGAYKEVKIHTDASKCNMFTPMQRVSTDSRQSSGDRYFRPPEYGYEEAKHDVKVDPEKVKDERYWG